MNGELKYEKTAFNFAEGEPKIAEKTVNGKAVKVALNIKPEGKVLLTCDDGILLLVSYSIGRGEVKIFFASAYPAHPAIRKLYEAELLSSMRYAVSKESVWAESSLGTQFAVYEREDGRDVYFLAQDWYRAPEAIREAKLKVGKSSHTVNFPFGVMIKATVASDYAAYAHTEDGEAIFVKNGVEKLQGTGKVRFTLINGAQSREEVIDFKDGPGCRN